MGTLSGGVVRYYGDFSDDMVGPHAKLGLRFIAMDRLWIGGSIGVGEYRWKVNPTRIAGYPDYFGPNAAIGDLYPGTSTTIEAINESRLTTADLLLHYVLVPDIPASPFITAGVGWASFAPSNSEEHSALPNRLNQQYSLWSFSAVLGGGVVIPISARVGLEFSGDYRWVFSKYLDDVAFNAKNDGISTFSIGLTYRFNNPTHCCEEPEEDIPAYESTSCVDNCCDYCNNVSDCCESDCNDCCNHCCKCCCCCMCCCCGQPTASPAGGGATPGGGSGGSMADAAPPKETPPVVAKGTPEPMDVPCPPGQHRECFGPPGYGICVDDGPPLGPERIRWELAETLADGSLLRSTEGKWYRKQILPDGSTRITKGNLPFESTECKECKEKQEQRR